MNGALRRMGYGTGEMSAHGFRAAASTLLNESGRFSADAIEWALAHLVRATDGTANDDQTLAVTVAAHTVVFADSNGHTVTDTLDVNNKLLMEVVAEPPGGAVLSTRTLNYDDQGRLARDQTNFQDGHQQITVNGTANAQSFATNNVLTDTHGNVTINQLIYDDGHQTVTYNDIANVQPWRVNNPLNAAAGRLLRTS